MSGDGDGVKRPLLGLALNRPSVRVDLGNADQGTFASGSRTNHSRTPSNQARTPSHQVRTPSVSLHGRQFEAMRLTSTEEEVKMYKQKYHQQDMRQVSFIELFRKAANEAAEGSYVVHLEDSLSEALSPGRSGSSPREDASAEQTETELDTASSSDSSDDEEDRPRTLKRVVFKWRIKVLKFMRKQGERAWIIFQIAFTVLAALTALFVGYQDSLSDKQIFRTFLGVPMLSWLILAALLFPVISLGDWVVDMTVRIVELVATAAQLDNVHYALMGMSTALKLVMIAVMQKLLVVVVMREHSINLPEAADKNLDRINALSSCFVIFSLVELAKVLGCRLLSLRVNAGTLFDLLKNTIEKERSLNMIMVEPRELMSWQHSDERIRAIAKLREIPEWSVKQYLRDLYERSLPVENSMSTSFTDRITDLVALFRTMPERQLDEHATCAAEYCWLTVRKDVMSDEMSKRDLAPMFTTDEETDITYSLFDVDGDGYVTEPEVHSVFKVMYRERRNLARTLRDNDDVISTLQTLLGLFMHTLALVAYLACFHVDIGHLLITLSSLSLAFAFVFGNSLKTVYESVVFLFVIRPYQVGHFIVYKGDMHTVKNFGLLSTQLLRYDGRRIWVPNETLMATDIINVTSSRNIVDRISFEVDIHRMTPALCSDLEERMRNMMEHEEPRRLFNRNFPPNCYIHGLSDPLKYKVGLTYELAFCGERYARAVEARTLVNHVVGQWIVTHKLTHSMSVQPNINFSDTYK